MLTEETFINHCDFEKGTPQYDAYVKGIADGKFIAFHMIIDQIADWLHYSEVRIVKGKGYLYKPAIIEEICRKYNAILGQEAKERNLTLERIKKIDNETLPNNTDTCRRNTSRL